MPARPRVANKIPPRRIPSTIRKMDKHSRGSTSSRTRVSSRIRLNRSRRQSRSPRPIRNPVFSRSPPKRHASPSPKRNFRRDEMRTLPKRPRASSKNSNSPRRSSPSLRSERLQRSDVQHERFQRERKEHPINKTRDYKSSGSSEKKLTEKPSYEGPRKEFIYSQDELKKITKRISRDFDANGKPFIRNIIHPESVTIPRRPALGE